MSTPTHRWLALSARAPSEEGAKLLPEGLVLLGGRAVQETNEGYTTYFPEPANLPTFLRRARQSLMAHTGLPAVELRWRWQEHRAWEELWRRGLGPRRVTGRMIVTPTWKDPEAGPGDVVVRLDPGMAFGTAEHASTRGCLRLLEPVLRTGARILDVGTGSGILAIAAARLGAASVVAVESDSYACETARENVKVNGVAPLVQVLERTAQADTLEGLGPFDGAMCNMETPLLLPLLGPIRRSTGPGGWIVVGGILTAERGAILQAAGGLDLKLVAEDTEEGWWSARLMRLSPS